ncbi:MAG TPA: YceI family protein [Luteimonas sp.]|jgi:polyisoprenoid-binding protein YceI|nr:YceI family protein [Luteimonas sp.]
MRLIPYAAAALLLVAGTAVAAPVRYDLDPNHTRIDFSWTHFGFSHPMGRFDRFDGDFRFDPADPTKSSVTVTIPVSSIDTGVAKLDAHLQTADFFDVANYPTATFKSTRVERAGEHGLKVTGDLTLHGVTRPVVLDVVINKIGPHPMAGRAAAGFDATTTIKRSDFGISNYVPNVSDEIRLSISTEAMVPAPGH